MSVAQKVSPAVVKAAVKLYTIPGTGASVAAAGIGLVAKWGDRQFTWAWPELKRKGYDIGGVTSYYWCAAYVRLAFFLATGFDIAKYCSGWYNCGALWSYFDAAPNWITVTPAQARAGDWAIVGYDYGTTHTFLVRGNLQAGRWLPTSEGDTSKPGFIGSDTLGGCSVNKLRDMNIYSNHTGMSAGYFIRIWRPPFTNVTPASAPAPATGLNAILDKAHRIKLQRVLGVAQDGDIGPKTISALQVKAGHTPDGVLSEPSQVIQQVQKYLSRDWGWGSFSLTVDGYPGPKTGQALAAYLDHSGAFTNLNRTTL